MKIKQQDETLALRKSCREGVCGSDGMNINGKNGLACVTKLKDLKEPVVIRPMPGLPVIKDLIVDMDQFFKNYHDVKPYFINNEEAPKTERLQSPEDRKKLDGLYECILCGACTTSCPSFWWGPDKCALYVDSLSTADGPVPTYLDLLRVTTQTIVTGLTEGQ